MTFCLKRCVTLWEDTPHIKYHIAMLGAHWPSGSGDMTYVAQREHVVKVPCDVVGGRSSLYVPTLPSLVSIDIEGMKMF